MTRRPNRLLPARRLSTFAFAAAFLAACEPPTPATPAAELPALERRVVSVAPPGPGQPLRVPAAALARRGGIPGVFVLEEPSAFPPPVRGPKGEPLPQARFRMVRTGESARQHVEVVSGLEGGEVLVLGPHADVHDGSPIVVRR